MILKLRQTEETGHLQRIARELSVFYDIRLEREIFEDDLTDLSLDFKNKEITKCPKISFLHFEIGGEPKTYKPYQINFKIYQLKK